MLSLDEFKEAIEFIKAQDEKENKFCEVLESLSPDCFVDCFLYSEYETHYVNMIKKAMNIPDNDDTLEWWLYDCDYGKCAELTSKDGVEFVLNSTELLYDYIVNEVSK